MDIILKEDIDNLGLEMDIVSVKPGYARNFLIPQGKAYLATPAKKDEREKLLASRKSQEEAIIKEAKEKLEALSKIELVIKAKAGKDKLFGSINNADVSAEIEKKGVQIDKKYIKVPGNSIKRVGSYTAKIRLHREVEGDFSFEVQGEEVKEK